MKHYEHITAALAAANANLLITQLAEMVECLPEEDRKQWRKQLKDIERDLDEIAHEAYAMQVAIIKNQNPI